MIRLSAIRIPSVSSFEEPELPQAQTQILAGRLKVESGGRLVGWGSVQKPVSPACHPAVDSQITQVEAASPTSNRLQAIAASQCN